MNKTLNDRLVEAFFGHISEKIEGSNPSCLKLCKRVATEAFHFLEAAVSSGDSEPLTYTYNLYDEIDIDLIWQLFSNDTKSFYNCRFKKSKSKH